MHGRNPTTAGMEYTALHCPGGWQRPLAAAIGSTLLLLPPHLTTTPPNPPAAPPLHRRMLLKDPSQRIPIPDIMQHAWFQRSMPPGLLNCKADPSKAQQVGPGAAGRSKNWEGPQGSLKPPWPPSNLADDANCPASGLPRERAAIVP